MHAEQLAYEEAKRSIDRQSANLDGLRSRAGILLAAISLATSFLGGQVLAADEFSAWAGAATVFFLAAGSACVAILWPTAEWKFNLSATKIIAQLERTEPPPSVDEILRELSLRHELNYDDNETRLGALFWLFRIACGLLGLEIVLWTIALGS